MNLFNNPSNSIQVPANADLIPIFSGTSDIGSSTSYFATLYANDIIANTINIGNNPVIISGTSSGNGYNVFNKKSGSNLVFNTISGNGTTSVTYSNGLINISGSTTYISGTSPVSVSNGLITISQSNSGTNGYLSSTDWNTFNNKQVSGNYVVSGTDAILNTLNITGSQFLVPGLILGPTGTTASTPQIECSNIGGNGTNGDLRLRSDGNLQLLATNGIQLQNSATTSNLYPSSHYGASVGMSGTEYNEIYAQTIYQNSVQVINTASSSGTGINLYNSKSGSNLVFNTISGNGLCNVTYSNGLINISGIGTVMSGTSPISVSNGLISIASGSSTQNGYISSGDWTKFNYIYTSGVTNVSSSGVGVALFNNKSNNNLVLNTISGNGTVSVTYANGLINISGSSASGFVLKTGDTMTGTLSGQSIVPTTSGTYNLGSLALDYNNTYSNNYYASGTKMLPRYKTELSNISQINSTVGLLYKSYATGAKPTTDPSSTGLDNGGCDPVITETSGVIRRVSFISGGAAVGVSTVSGTVYAQFDIYELLTTTRNLLGSVMVPFSSSGVGINNNIGTASKVFGTASCNIAVSGGSAVGCQWTNITGSPSGCNAFRNLNVSITSTENSW
jgi:hypothetical protein